jgi:hypothetical protein
MPRGATARLKQAQMKARQSAARARERYKAGEVQFGTGVILGGAASGALDGYGFDFEIGDFEFGYGLPVGIALVLGDGFGSKLGKGAGYGMLAAEVSHLVSDLVSDMMDEGEMDEPDELDEGDQ